MNDKPKMIGTCTICCRPVMENQKHIVVNTRRNKIHAHDKCYEAEQRELKAEKEAEA